MKVQLNIRSNSLHTSCVVTGFLLLKNQGQIELEINDLREKELITDAVIDAVIDGKMIAFDLMDGYSYDDFEWIERYFSNAHMIFKRSFSDDKNLIWENEIRNKMRPYGLNYFVTCKNNLLTQRKMSLASIVKWMKLTNSYIKDFEAPVLQDKKNPQILFLTRLWDPNGNDIKENKELAEERKYIDQTRIDTIKLLKREFGNMFFGGIYEDAYSVKYCPEYLVDKSISLKRFYLHRMKQSDICINTMGLHGSIGWKTAEYVAASRAIVSERLMYQTTGDFRDGKNYLSFETPEECVEKVLNLVKNKEKRLEISRENKKYYENYLRPDAQVSRALDIFLGRSKDA